MEEIKISKLISNYEFTVGIMRIITNKSFDNLIKILSLYNKIKNITVKKTSIRLMIDNIEYSFVSKQTKEIEAEEITDTITDTITNEIVEDVDQNINKLSSGLMRSIIINHYKSKI